MVDLKRMLVLPRRFSVAAASAPLSLCRCYCVAGVVVDFVLLLVLPYCFSVAAAAAPVLLCFVVTLSLLQYAITCGWYHCHAVPV